MKMNMGRGSVAPDNKSPCEREVTLVPGQSLSRSSSLSQVHVNRPLESKWARKLKFWRQAFLVMIHQKSSKSRGVMYLRCVGLTKLLNSLTMDKVTSSIELKTSQRIENVFWQSLKVEVNRSIIWKLTILPFLKKWVNICLTICILESFLFLKVFKWK